MIAYIGTYTKKDSNGIYKLNIDNNKIISYDLVANIDNPTYLQIDKTNNILYCNNSKKNEAGITSFKINEDFSLTKISESMTNNKNACYLELDPYKNQIYSTIYSMGLFESRSYTPLNGQVNKVNYSLKIEGSSINKERQESSHFHIAYLYNSHIYICDLGSDYIYIIDNKDFSIKQKLKLKPGCGPRHICINNDHAYVVTELSNELIELTHNKNTGQLKINKYFSLIPDDFNENSQAAAIRISQDKKFIYISNRGYDHINVFSINSKGKIIKNIQNISTYGHWCRDFNISNDGKLLIAVHEKSYNVSIFNINEDGILNFISNDIKIPEATCIAFY